MKPGLSLFIALRYFFSKKSQRAINVISIISVLGVMIGTAALIIVLSVFNGFEDLILRLYNSFDPDLRVELAAGKTFGTDRIDINKLRQIEGVQYVTDIVEESALAKYHDRQYIIKLKGVGDDFEKVTGLDTMIVDGQFRLHSGDTNFAIIGSAVAYNLDIQLKNRFYQVEIFGPKGAASNFLDPEGSFNRRYVLPEGIFSVQQEFDAKYFVVPIRFARDVFDYENKLTAFEIKLNKNANENEVVSQIKTLAGNDFLVKNRFEQHKLIYKIMRSEKWAVFLILTFILIIAIFNVISSLTMLVIEKKKDITIYQSMGAEVSFLRKIFLTEGMFITLAGALSGLLTGLLVCYIQQYFGIVKLSGSGSFIIDSYPVKLVPLDFLYVFITVCGIGLLAAWYPARRLIKDEMNLKVIANDK